MEEKVIVENSIRTWYIMIIDMYFPYIVTCRDTLSPHDPYWRLTYLLQWQCWISWLLCLLGFPQHRRWIRSFPDLDWWTSARCPPALSPLRLFREDFPPDTVPVLRSPTDIHEWILLCHQTGCEAKKDHHNVMSFQNNSRYSHVCSRLTSIFSHLLKEDSWHSH